MMNDKKAQSQSSDKLLLILETISENRLPIRLQDLAEKVGMTQSSVLRYLKALLGTNYVYQEEMTGRYALTWKICRIGESLNSPLGMRNIVAPFINKLATTLNLGACLVVNQLNQCMYLDCIDISRSSDKTLQYIGKRAPLHVTSSGKILLSSFSETQLDEYISSCGLVKYTDNTITDKTELIKELAKIKEQGYATDNEECEKGLTCFSMPLRSYSGAIVAAISIFGDTERMTKDMMMNKIYPMLASEIKIISARLGYEEDERRD